MRTLYILSLLLAFSGALFTSIDAKATTKDSYYFMKDDGEFTDAEKDEEAQFVFDRCNANFIQRVYFDCACVAGAVRQDRDKKDITPQGMLVSSYMSEENPQCANSVGIAGEAYEFCTEYARVFRERQTNNGDYCKCVANKTANGFKKKPRLSMRHIEDIRLKSMMSCEDDFPESP